MEQFGVPLDQLILDMHELEALLSRVSRCPRRSAARGAPVRPAGDSVDRSSLSRGRFERRRSIGSHIASGRGFSLLSWRPPTDTQMLPRVLP